MSTIGQSGFPSGAQVKHFTGTITRSSASNAALFTLPAGCTILSMRVIGSVVSDAGTNARISVGCNTSERIFISEFNVKTNGNLQSYPSSSLMLGTQSDPNPISVIGRYDEIGSASSVGSWVIDFEVL